MTASEKFIKLIAPSNKNFAVFMILSGLATVYFAFTGTMFEWAIVIALCIYKVMVIGSVYLHRYLTHRSFVAPKWFEYLCGVSVMMGGGNTTSLAWVAIHREHHVFSDRPGDPHSPLEHGFWKIQLRMNNYSPKLKYVPDLTRIKFYTHTHHFYWLYSLAFAAILYLIDPRAVLYAYFVPSFIAGHIGTSISSFAHLYGYQNFNTKDHSKNHILVGYILGGEWHNNHHHSPRNPNQQVKWWEFDPGYWLIQLVRLDRPKKTKDV